MIVTLTQLREADACQPQVALFKATFGKQVRVTRRACLQHAQTFDFSWAGMTLLYGKQYREFCKRLNVICDRYWTAVYAAQRDSSLSVERSIETEAFLARKLRQDTARAFWEASKVEN